jgi:hypothetical protein
MIDPAKKTSSFFLSFGKVKTLIPLTEKIKQLNFVGSAV